MRDPDIGERFRVRTLLPYQRRWVADRAGLKVIEKARRVGISWAEAYHAVMHAGAGGGNVYYQAYNREMTRGFIADCADWARQLQLAAGSSGETLVDDGRGIHAFRIAFASGHEILAMTSAPRTFRSKGRPGDLAIVDEAAFVDDLGQVLKAAMAFRVWGGRAHVISSHNGEANPFATLCRDLREGARPGSLHRITLKEALSQGLFRRIVEGQEQPWSAEAEDTWEAELRAEYGTHAGEELDCVPAAGAGGGDAVELFARMGAVLGPELGFPGILGLCRPGLLLAFDDTAEETLGERLLERDAMQRAGPGAFAQVAAESGEGVGLAVVAADDVRPAAPDAEGHRRLQHLAQVVDEGRLVDDGEVAGPALGAEGAGRRRHGKNFVARGEGDAEGVDAPAIVDEGFAAGACRELQLARPIRAIRDEAPGHLPVVGLVIDVAAAGARVHHRVVGLGPGDADATRLLDHLEAGTVCHPTPLVGKQGADAETFANVGVAHVRNMARPGAGSHRTNVRGVRDRASCRVIVYRGVDMGR